MLICLIHLRIPLDLGYWKLFKLDFWLCSPSISSRKVLHTSRPMRDTLFRELVVFLQIRRIKDAIINYMQQANIRYAWATGWLGDPITFKTNGALLVTELPGRILTNSNTVLHADRPGIFFLVRHDDAPSYNFTVARCQKCYLSH